MDEIGVESARLWQKDFLDSALDTLPNSGRVFQRETNKTHSSLCLSGTGTVIKTLGISYPE
jgi:hypothetical protein